MRMSGGDSAQVEGATISGIAVTDALGFRRAGRGAKRA